MNFYHFLKKESNALEMSLLVYYSLAGFLNFLIIAVIIYSLGAVDSQSHAISIVILLVSIVGFVIVQKYSLDQTCRIVEQIITKIRIRLTDHIRRIDLRSYESIHHEDFLMLLTRDTTDISGAAQNISRIVSSIALVLVACLYITLLSPLALLISGIVIFYGIRIYQKQIAEYEEEKYLAAEKENRFFALMRHLLSGFKEIKLNENKNNDLYHNDMVPVSAQAKWHNISATHCLNHSVVFSQVFSYLLLGFLIFLYPKLVQIDQSTLIQVVGLILFVTTGPVREIVGSLPLVERANAAIANIREMEGQLGQLDIHPIPSAEDIRTTKPFLSLEFNNVTFAYNHSQKGKAFRIGPIDLTIHRGEVVFFMGGNGTG
ncbi:hypothetical protein GF373_10865, partial [bacterium]|nr:hypothetical protein [bacterium]